MALVLLLVHVALTWDWSDCALSTGLMWCLMKVYYSISISALRLIQQSCSKQRFSRMLTELELEIQWRKARSRAGAVRLVVL
jgi:hypothetical protein